MQALFISIDTDAAGTWKFCIINAFSPFSPSWYQRHSLISNLQTGDKDAIHYATASGLCFLWPNLATEIVEVVHHQKVLFTKRQLAKKSTHT